MPPASAHAEVGGVSSLHDPARTPEDTLTTGHEDDPKAWAAIERVRADLAEYGRQLGVRKRD